MSIPHTRLNILWLEDGIKLLYNYNRFEDNLIDAYLINTESKDVYRFKYLEPQLNIGGINAVYQSADVPGLIEQSEYYIRTDTSDATINLIYDGLDTVAKIETLRGLTQIVKGKQAPPICIFKLGNLPIKTVVITNVQPQYDLSYNSDGFPDIDLRFYTGIVVVGSPNAGRIFRATCRLTMKEVPEPKGVYNFFGL